jgi:molybdopterin converting factor small subunit
MRVIIRFIATYRSNLPSGTEGNTCVLEVAPGTSAGDLAGQYGIPLDNSSVILVNGHTVDLAVPLQEGDVLAAFPAMAGG